MDNRTEQQFIDYLMNKYDEYDNMDDEVRSLISEYAKDHVNLNRQLAEQEEKYKAIINEYREMIEVWKTQAKESLDAVTLLLNNVKNNNKIEL